MTASLQHRLPFDPNISLDSDDAQRKDQLDLLRSVWCDGSDVPLLSPMLPLHPRSLLPIQISI